MSINRSGPNLGKLSQGKGFDDSLKPFLPPELVGGMLPYVSGTEEEAVWNAASQACATEKVHFTYTIEDNRVWYLACPSFSLASNPDSWCPLAAALPGNSEYWDRETVYMYEQEGLASALRWDPETGRMQVFLGASRTILPRIQSMDANFVNIKPEGADIVPWKNRSLKTEKLSRSTVMGLFYAGLLIAICSVLILIYSYLSINFMQRDLTRVRQESDNAATDLMIKAANVMQSDTIKHMVRIQELLDQLSRVDGTLVKYEVDGNSVEWEALLPEAFAKEFPTATPLQLEEDGRVRIKSNRM